MTSQNLYNFVEIVKDMNLGVTANRLHTSQQALSGQIKRLEEYFGVKLFYRTPNLVLSKEGELLLKEAQTIIDAENRLFMAYGTKFNQNSGRIKVACGLARSKYYLPTALSRFSEKYPEVAVSCVDENLYTGKNIFAGTDIDLLIGRFSGSRDGLKVKKLFNTPATLVISPGMIEEHLDCDIDEFIKNAQENGIDLSTLPNTMPLLYTSSMNQEHWLSNEIPCIKDFSRLKLSYGEGNVPLDICKKGRAMVIVSSIYVKYLNAITPVEKQNELCFFNILHKGEYYSEPEFIAYNNNIVHPQFFFDFIQTLYEVMQELGLEIEGKK